MVINIHPKAADNFNQKARKFFNLSIALLVESIHKNKSINEVATKKTINNLFISWIKNKLIESNAEDFTEYLISELERIIDVYEVWMPISNLYIENSFSIGKIHFKPITKKIIDKLIPSREILGDKADEYENKQKC
jgi:hypothetical protein